jgi:hypothetical protein
MTAQQQLSGFGNELSTYYLMSFKKDKLHLDRRKRQR